MITNDRNKDRNIMQNELDRLFQARLSRYTAGLTPAGLIQVIVAWLSQLALCPGRLIELHTFPLQHSEAFLRELSKYAGISCGNDPRFKSNFMNNLLLRLREPMFTNDKRTMHNERSEP